MFKEQKRGHETEAWRTAAETCGSSSCCQGGGHVKHVPPPPQSKSKGPQVHPADASFLSHQRGAGFPSQNWFVSSRGAIRSTTTADLLTSFCRPALLPLLLLKLHSTRNTETLVHPHNQQQVSVITILCAGFEGSHGVISPDQRFLQQSSTVAPTKTAAASLLTEPNTPDVCGVPS